VIEIESAKEVLIGFALSAVLRDDHAGHRFEHFTLPHEWPHLELPCCDRTLAGRRGDADEILRRVLDVGEVRERAFADDHHFRAQHEVHHVVKCSRLSSRDDEVAMGDGREVDETYR